MAPLNGSSQKPNPSPPLGALGAKQREKSRCAGEIGANECEASRTKSARFATPVRQVGRKGVAEAVGLGRMRPKRVWPDDGRWYPASELLRPRGYVIVRATGEVLSSVVADVCRERREAVGSAVLSDRPCEGGRGGLR